MAIRTVSLLAAGAALRLAASPFLTVPQHDRRLDAITTASVDVSANGRYVAFESGARLVPADTDDRRDIYVLDLETRQVTLESSAADEGLDAAHPRISGDGRYLVFESTSAGVEGAPSRTRIVLCDRRSGTSTIVDAGPGGEAANDSSRDPDISDDGRVVVFTSSATNLVAGPDANGRGEDVYALDVSSRTVQRVSVDAAGVQPADGSSISPAVSGDGRWVAFASSALLVPLAPGQVPKSEPRQVYVRDLGSRTTTRVSTGTRGSPSDRDSWGPAIDRDGRFVAFASRATNLAGRVRKGTTNVFLRDLHTDSMTLVSRSADGDGGNGTSVDPSMSADGRFIAFQSDAPDLVCGKRCPPGAEDINLLPDVFLFDRGTAAIVRVSRDDGGEWMEASRGPALDGSGRVLAFASRHPIDALDRGDDFDLFVKIDGGTSLEMGAGGPDASRR